MNHFSRSATIFGSNADAGTHELGAALLRADFHRVVDLLLAPRPGLARRAPAANVARAASIPLARRSN